MKTQNGKKYETNENEEQFLLCKLHFSEVIVYEYGVSSNVWMFFRI